jgi:hypothetical protein
MEDKEQHRRWMIQGKGSR